MLKFTVNYYLGDSREEYLACYQELYKKVRYVLTHSVHYLYYIRNDNDIQ